MIYFTLLTSANNPGNSLQREAIKILEKSSNQLTDDGAKFVRELTRKIEDLNGGFPRCTPLIVSTNRGYNENEKRLWVGNHLSTIATFVLHPVYAGEEAAHGS